MLIHLFDQGTQKRRASASQKDCGQFTYHLSLDGQLRRFATEVLQIAEGIMPV
jgi:hypothetical protein